ncbi:MAG: transposase [Proteobacteria bacterium]|nr:transposase [Pseudomonadota bacterium]
MPRYRRLFLPHFPLHIVQRGHDRQPVFVERVDYEYYLSNLKEMKNKLSISVYAYCLMTNHVHLLIMPDQNTDNVSQLLRVLAGRQTRYVNKLEKRTGTLWEGRFKSSLVDSHSYLLACLIFPRDTGHRVKNHIMTVIQNEVLDGKSTQNIQ